jgi:hypothetical protein
LASTCLIAFSFALRVYFTLLSRPLFCFSPKLDPGFPHNLSFFCVQWFKVRGTSLFCIIGRIADHHCLICIFILQKRWLPLYIQ